MGTKFVYVNIITRDWKKIARFYENVFKCIPLPPERNLSGEWIQTGIINAVIGGIVETERIKTKVKPK